MKFPIIQRQSYVIYLEYWDDAYWYHTDVFNWTAQVKKEYLEDLENLQKAVKQDFYGLVLEDEKLGKFGRAIGFSKDHERETFDGRVADIYIRKYNG